MRAIIQAGRRARGRSPWGAPGWESSDVERARSAATTSWRGLSVNQGAQARSSSCSRESGDLVGEPRPITHAVKFFEKGDRPLEIITSRQWFITTIEHRDALLARGRELQLASAVHARALRELGQRPERRLVRQPPALLRRAVPGLVPARRATARSLYDAADRRRARSSCRSIPRPTCPTATRPSSAAQPGGFVGDPDVMDTWATSSLTPQIAGRLGEDPDLFAQRLPDGPAPAGARHHPHLAVLDGPALAPRARRAAVDATPRSPAGCSTPTARRCRSRRATSSRRWTCSRSTAPTACATGRRAAGPGTDTAFDAAADEGRPPAGDEAAERLEVRARRPAARRARAHRTRSTAR